MWSHEWQDNRFTRVSVPLQSDCFNWFASPWYCFWANNCQIHHRPHRRRVPFNPFIYIYTIEQGDIPIHITIRTERISPFVQGASNRNLHSTSLIVVTRRRRTIHVYHTHTPTYRDLHTPTENSSFHFSSLCRNSFEDPIRTCWVMQFPSLPRISKKRILE